MLSLCILTNKPPTTWHVGNKDMADSSSLPIGWKHWASLGDQLASTCPCFPQRALATFVLCMPGASLRSTRTFLKRQQTFQGAGRNQSTGAPRSPAPSCLWASTCSLTCFHLNTDQPWSLNRAPRGCYFKLTFHKVRGSTSLSELSSSRFLKDFIQEYV